MNAQERNIVARIAMLNAESEAYVAAHEARVDAIFAELEPQRFAELQRQHPDECAVIFAAVPDAEVVSTLDMLISELGTFTTLPSEDRAYVGEMFMKLHEVRRCLLDGDFLNAWRGTIDVQQRLHWVAKGRKRNAVRASHRSIDPNVLDELDRVGQRVSLWGERLRRPMGVV